MKRIVASVLSIVIVLLMFSACGTHSSDIENQPSSSIPTETATTQAESFTEDNTPEQSEMPVADAAPTTEAASEPVSSPAPSAPPTDTSLPTMDVPPTQTPPQSTTAIPTPAPTTTPTTESPPSPPSSPDLTSSDGMLSISITIGSAVFSAKLYDNDTVNALVELFPLTVDMTELNGNEKFYYLTNSLPTDSKRVGSVSTGDLMLYGSDCLVLFYESFTTSYSYTKLGYIEDVSGLVDILGYGNVQALFAVE